ncbi:MAG: hypothetical protein WDM80_15575 [Limisphaerales bacterium]
MSTGRPQENQFNSPDGRRWLMRISPWKNGATVHGLICNLLDQTQRQELQARVGKTQKKPKIRNSPRKLAA